MTSTAHHIPRELDARSGDGLTVRLLWHPAEDSLLVTVDDSRLHEHHVIPVAADDVLEAFHHPFAYAAATRGRGSRVPAWS